MPSGLARRGGQADRAFRSATERAEREPRDVLIAPPWMGYTPDPNPSVLDFRHNTGATTNIVAVGEELRLDLGFERVSPPELPLGDDGAGAGAAPASSANAQPVVLIDYFVRSPLSTSSNQLTALTADTSAPQNSHVWKLAGGVWTEVPPAAAAADLTFEVDDAVDTTTFPNGIPTNAPGGPVEEPVQIIVAEDNEVTFWPIDNGSGNVDEYDQLITSPTTFKAQSVETFGSRACFLNTEEGGTAYPQRMRFSIPANPTDVADASIGAGFVDVLDTCGPGLRLLKLGNVLVGYFCNAIVFYRRTFVSLAPFDDPQYVTTQVSLMGPRAVVALDEARHFFISDEGWFLMDESGVLTEVGVMDVGGNTTRKWFRTFTSLMNHTFKHRTETVFDPERRQVRISFPSTASTDGTPDQLWIYDIDDDRVWPQSQYGTTHPECYFYGPSEEASALTWAQATFSWDSTSLRWIDYSTQIGQDTVYHGTNNGYIYQMSRGSVSRSDESGNLTIPSMIYETPRIPIEYPPLWKEANRFDLEVQGPSSASVSLLVFVDNQTTGRTATLDTGFPTTIYTTSRYGGTHHALLWNTTADIRVRAMRYRYTPHKGEVQRYR